MLDLSGEAHDAESLADFRAIVIPALKRIVRSDMVAYNEVGEGGVPLVTIADPAPSPELIEAWGRLAGQNPLYQRFVRTRDGRAYRLSDVIDRSRFESLELYRAIFVPLGVAHQIAITLPARRHVTIAFALSRGGEDYTQRDRDLLDLLRPHLVQAYRNAELRERRRAIVDALRDGLDDTAEAVAVLDVHGDVVFATAAGRELLERVSGEADGRLPAALAAAVTAPGGEHVVTLAPGLVARVVPGSGTGAVLFFDALGPALSRRRLLEIGLTAREVDVLRELAGGRTSIEAGAALGICARTVDKHTENISRKLGVRTRRQAIAMAFAVARAGEVPTAADL